MPGDHGQDGGRVQQTRCREGSTLTEDGISIAGDVSRCRPECGAFLERWAPWWEAQKRGGRAALLAVRPRDVYLAELGGKPRNMVRKAEGLYSCRTYLRDSHLDEMHAINTSKLMRSGGRMSEAYLRPLAPSAREPIGCGRHHALWHGAFRRLDGRLVAYCHLVRLGDLQVVNTMLGHADAPASVNGLVAHLVEYSSSCERGVRFLHYLTLSSSPDGLARFKMSVGFKEVEIG